MIIAALYDDSSIEINGTADALRQLSKQIKECYGLCHIHLNYQNESDWRGLRFAKMIELRLNDELVSLAVNRENIVISGSKEKLDILIQNILFLADGPRRDSTNTISNHIHIEHYPDAFPFLTETALPLIVTRLET